MLGGKEMYPLNAKKILLIGRVASASLLSIATVFSAFAGTQAQADIKVELSNSVRNPSASQNFVSYLRDDERINFAISLSPRNVAAFEAFVDDVSNPHSANYRQFITPEQVGEKFGPAQADVDTAVKFLKSNGIQVSEISKNKMVIVATGTAKQVGAAFDTNLIQAVKVGVNGLPLFYRTNISPLHVPSSLAEKVVSVDGIDSSMERKARATTTNIVPTTFRAGYNSAPIYNAGFQGQGVNVAIANWDGYDVANNIPAEVAAYGLPVPAAGAGSNVFDVPILKNGIPIGPNFQGAGEGDLDLQSVVGSAPLATVFVYDDTTNDFAAPITTLAKISSDNLADIVTESYGWLTFNTVSWNSGTFKVCHYLHLSMTAQGMTYLAATGDNGTDGITRRFARFGYPDIDPEVLMVGGSVLTVDATTGARVKEVTWGLTGGVGGTGTFDPYDDNLHGFGYNLPPVYQRVAILGLTRKYPFRLFPDIVAASGGQDGIGNLDGTGWATTIFYTIEGAPPFTFQTVIDGTSYASPATAGGLATVWCQLFTGVTPNFKRSNVRLGRIQDVLYQNGGTNIFNDITQGTSIGIIPGTNSNARPGVGFDLASGWGSLNFANLYTLLNSILNPGG